VEIDPPAGSRVCLEMRWALSAVTLLSLTAGAAAAPQIATSPPAPAPVCARLAATMTAREEAVPSSGPRKVWLSWYELDTPRDLAAAVTGKVTRVLGVRGGLVLAIATEAQRKRLAPDIMMIREADELDWVGCGSLGYQAPLSGRVTSRVSLPAAWRARDGASPHKRDTYCLQLGVPPLDDEDQGALALALGLNDAAPLDCSAAPATCTISLTGREASAVAKLRFARGMFRREPAFKLGASLACPGQGDLPIAPAELPAVLRAATARPAERINVTVVLDGEPAEMAAVQAHLPASARLVEGSGYLVTLSLERRALPALAAMPAVEAISEQGPAPAISTPGLAGD
jgi:hypothetical protein